MYIATHWDPLYWNAACLIVNSGSLEDEDYELDEDGEPIKKKEKSADYAKMAKALGDIITAGVKVSLIDINNSDYGFNINEETREIMFGLKALSGVNAEVVEKIIAGRPYFGIADFMYRCPLDKRPMLSLIKAGAFDKLENEWGKQVNIEPRLLVMGYYLLKKSDLKSKLTLQNFNGLIQKDLVPDSLIFQKKVYNFNKYLKANCKIGQYYIFDDICMTFYSANFDMDKLEVINGCTCIKQITWDKLYQDEMDKSRDWIKSNQTQLLKEYNTILFKESWEKDAAGSISAWEMEALCFYYHAHELANVDRAKYGLVEFDALPENPEVDYYFKRKGIEIPIFKTFKLIGTVISKNDTRSTVSLLTKSGVVNVKFTKEYYAMFARQISEKQEDGKKKVMEKGWFRRGEKVMVTGFRRDDTFVAKSYKHTPTHQLYKIVDLLNSGTEMVLEHERYEIEVA